MTDTFRNINYLQDRNVVINLSSLSLSDALGDPHNVPTFLLLQFNVRVENTVVKLLHEAVHVELDLKE